MALHKSGVTKLRPNDVIFPSLNHTIVTILSYLQSLGQLEKFTFAASYGPLSKKMRFQKQLFKSHFLRALLTWRCKIYYFCKVDYKGLEWNVKKWVVVEQKCVRVQFKGRFLAFLGGLNQFCSSILSKVMAENRRVLCAHHIQHVIKLGVKSAHRRQPLQPKCL